jgi:hypothetical protein
MKLALVKELHLNIGMQVIFLLLLLEMISTPPPQTVNNSFI